MTAILVDQIHRLTIEDYLRLVCDDTSPDWGPTELVEGVVYNVSPESSRHSDATVGVFDGLRAVFPVRKVRLGGSVEIGPQSLWIPDAYVLLAGADAERTYVLATDVELVVEVSISTRRTDLAAKLRGYATAGIPQYWVFSPADGDAHVLCHRVPTGDRYELVERVELPGGYETIDVAALLG